MTPADEAAPEPSPDSVPSDEVLLHSLGVLFPVIVPALAMAGARRIVEVGVEAGQMTQHVRDDVAGVDGSCVGIDPAPNDRVRAVYAADARLELVEGRSPQALEDLEGADAYLIDGDHNYWTVSGELRAIAAAAGTDRHPLVFLHDVGWPAGRRDQYYVPDQLPPEAVHPYTYSQGVRMDVPGTVDGGFRGEGVFAWAIEEGGPRNGVRTALDDFLEESPRFRVAIVPSVFGLAVLSTVDAPFAGALDDHLRDWADNPLLAAVEANRLALYDRVLILQDLLADAGDAGPRLRNENARLRARVRELEGRLGDIRAEVEAMSYLKALRAVDLVERPARRKRAGLTLRTRLVELQSTATANPDADPADSTREAVE